MLRARPREVRFTSLLLTACLLLGACHTAAGAVLEVHSEDHDLSIAEAVAASRPGDTIVVHTGVYIANDIVVNKPLTIIGQNWPVLDASGRGGILRIGSSDVTVTGIQFRGVATSFVAEYAAVLLENVSNVRISGNRMSATFFAVYAANSHGCIIENNIIEASETRLTSAGNGIHLWYCNNMTISGNTITGHRDGIYLEFVGNSGIFNNRCLKNLRYGLHFMFSDSCQYENNLFSGNSAGVAVMYTYEVTMMGNTFEDSWGGASYGLLLKDIKDSRISSNHFTNNSIGIHMEGCDRVQIEHNSFVANGWAIKIMANCLNNLVSENDFIDNSFQVATNSRQNHSRFDGNYWSTYRGFDLDRDGFGDQPYRPVSLFSLLVESNPPTLVLLRSLLVDVLCFAEQVMPNLTPETLADSNPRMKPTL